MPWHLPFWLLSRSNRAFRRWRIELWNDTVQSCGLRVMDNSRQTAALLQVEARAGAVSVCIEGPGDPKSGIRVTAILPRKPDFSRVGLRRLTSEPPRTRDFESGDELFDSAFSIEGPERLLRALLDAETRRLLAGALPESRLEISRGEIQLETRDEDLSAALTFLLDISGRLSRCIDLTQRLAENARQDPEAGVRLHNLLLLARHFPWFPETAEALRDACLDASPQIRLRAALELGEPGRDTLLELAESPVDDVAAQAVARLSRELPFERTRALLAGALKRRLLQTARACLKALGQSRDPAAVDVLAKVMEVEQGELAAAAALALGATRSPAAEPPLLLALQRDTTGLQVAAATALARTGTAVAVLPLQETAKRSPNDQKLQRATREAIAEIKSRLQGASPGQLSLAGTEAGQLALVPEAGQLSLAVDPAGQLSLAQPEAGQLSQAPGEG